MSRLRSFALTALSAVCLPIGLLIYFLTRRTPSWAYRAFVHLFCATSGRSNDVLSAMASWSPRRLKLELPSGVLGQMAGQELGSHLKQLRQQGYLVFAKALPEDVCQRLLRFALDTPATVRRMDHEPPGAVPRKALFDPASPMAVRYDYPPSALLGNADVQHLLADPSLLALCQAYLDALPRADVLSMWWHTHFHDRPDSEAAQFFHFDLDRMKWLKVFIYLTDVGPDNGPHTFIAGSHATGAIPSDLLSKGYARLSDEEVLSHFGGDRSVEFTAPRGTVIVEDTRGLHKGAPVRGTPRLILQLQFSNCLFGASYPGARIGNVVDPSLLTMLEVAPQVYWQYK
jgi:Phytanoyl-CoA dioxygenase (PhyH)